MQLVITMHLARGGGDGFFMIFLTFTKILFILKVTVS